MRINIAQCSTIKKDAHVAVQYGNEWYTGTVTLIHKGFYTVAFDIGESKKFSSAERLIPIMRKGKKRLTRLLKFNCCVSNLASLYQLRFIMAI